jgi:glutathione S-transferase
MKLYYLPPSSYCQKVIIAGQEKQVDFELVPVNLFNPEETAKYREIYPIGKIPLLILEDDHMIPESSFIIEYLDTHFDKGPQLIPQDADDSRKVRFHDRMLDLYLNSPSGSLFFEMRKSGAEQNTDQIKNWRNLAEITLQYIDKASNDKEWLFGDSFTLADISAAAALNVASLILPFDEYPNVQKYYQRLSERPSIAHVISEAKPYYEQLAS